MCRDAKNKSVGRTNIEVFKVLPEAGLVRHFVAVCGGARIT